MADEETTDVVDDIFPDDTPATETEGGGLASDFLADVLTDEDESQETEEKETETDTEGEEAEEKDESEETEEEESEDEDDTEEKEEPEETEEDEDPPKGSSKKASEDWKKLRGSRDKYKTQASELEGTIKEKEDKVTELEGKVAKLEELRGKAAISDELQEKLEKFDELEKTVAMLRVEEGSEYKKAVAEPLATIEEQVIALGKENEASLDAIFDAVNEPDLAKQRTKLKEVTAGWDEIDKVELRNMSADARVLFGKQRELRENAATAAKQQEETSKAEAEKTAAEAKKAFLKASDNVVSQIKEKMPFVPLRDGETVEDRAAALTEKLKSVDFDSQGVDTKAVAAASALALPTAIKTITKLQKEVSALEKRLEKKNAAKPTKTEAVADPVEEEDFFKAVGIETLDASQRLSVSL